MYNLETDRYVLPFSQNEVYPIHLICFPDHLGKGNVANLTAVTLIADQRLS